MQKIMNSEWVSWSAIYRCAEETELEIARWLKTNFLAMDERLRVERTAKLTDEAIAALDRALSATLGEVLKALSAARAAEGKALARVIDGHIVEIESLCKRAAERADATGRFATVLASK